MLGEVVQGYIIKKSIGHGRTGSLFLAVHPDGGKRLIVLRVNDSAEPRGFAAEAQEALYLSFLPRVTEELTDTGTQVLVAHVDFSAKGDTFSRYSNTHPIGRRRDLRGLVVGVLAALLTGIAGGVFGWWLKPSPKPIVVLKEKELPVPTPVECPACPVAAAPAPPAPVKPMAVKPQEPQCAFNDRLIEYARRHRTEMIQGLPESRYEESKPYSDRLADALLARDCRLTHQRLREMAKAFGYENDEL